MKILIIGKDNHLLWVQNIANAMSRIEHIKLQTIYINRLGFLNDASRNIKKILSLRDIYSNTNKSIKNKIKIFKPDTILIISPFLMDNSILENLKDIDKNINKIAWIGDMFGKEHKSMASVFDKLYMSDTYFITLSKKYNFPEASYLPLAANTDIFFNKNMQRNNSLLFVGASTKKREKLINNIEYNNIHIIGSKWSSLKNSICYNSKNVNLKQLSTLYNKTNIVLNINHDTNVINGLNMRSFEVPACKTCLIQENIEDIQYNFEKNREILVYNSLDELNEILQRIPNDKKMLKNIQENGLKRILAEHTYEHRAKNILKEIR